MHTLKNDNYTKIKTINLNFGPQHPAAHGVLRLILQLNGEVIEKMDAHIGLLHRGSEKLIEDKIYLQGMPYFDRFDYCSMMTQEHAYCLAIEKLLGTFNYSSNFVQIRTLFDEITRIINHLLAVACHALDVGSMSSVFWGFEDREKLMEFYERVSGARMHAAFYRPNEVNDNAMSIDLMDDILDFNRNFFTTLNEMHNVLTYNKIWKQRLVNIGVIDANDCYANGLTGVMSRSVGIKRDLRLSRNETYGHYYNLNFRGYLGSHGDCYDRFLIRMNEMSEATNLITQCVNKLLFQTKKASMLQKNTEKEGFGDKKIKKLETKTYIEKNYKNNNTKNMYNTMEETIQQFKYWSEGFAVPANIVYQSIESPKGEFGVTLIANNSNIPHKCKVRSPALQNLQVLSKLARGHFLADLITLIGTIDIVFGEVDR